MDDTNPVLDLPFELASLASAHRYQNWIKSVTVPHLGRRILELGSGIGTMSQHLPIRERLILSDVDESLLKTLRMRFPAGEKIAVINAAAAPLSAQLADEHLDTAVSFNVLEHVDDDAGLLRELIQLLRQSRSPDPKRIVTLVPAHEWAFGTIDRTFHHRRRYSDLTFRSTLLQAGAGKLSAANYWSRYMNLPGLLAWWLKGRLLKQNGIGAGNIKAFEALCPLIRPLDDFLHNVLQLPMGNSLITVYRVDA